MNIKIDKGVAFMDYQNLILTTKSVREYKKDSIESQTLKEIKDYALTCPKIDSSIAFEVRILSNSEAFLTLDGIAGYQGNMIDAPHYIVILSEKKGHYIENAAYIGESMILKALEIGIASCWISFHSSVKERLNLLSDKEVVALIALGYDANAPKKGTAVSFADYKLGIDEIVYIDKWGNGADASILEERGLLEAFMFSKLAPSTLNKQSWRFLLTSGKVILAMKKEKNVSDYEQKIDAGIIMLFFQLMVSSTLFDLKWNLEQPVDFLQIPKEFEIIAYCML